MPTRSLFKLLYWFFIQQLGNFTSFYLTSLSVGDSLIAFYKIFPQSDNHLCPFITMIWLFLKQKIWNKIKSQMLPNIVWNLAS